MSKKQQYLLWASIGVIYLSNLFVPILEIDAAQYAEMSREMLQSDNWLHLYDIGFDYLDKPPFIFWVSALSMKIFGISVSAYKFPSVLFAIWSIYALYRFAILFYSKETALTTAFIFASCQAMFLITNDIKTDTILMSFAVTAFWQLSSWLYANNKWGWIGGAIAIGGAMLTKGPIGLLIIGFGFVPHFIIKKQWKKFWRWQYVPLLLIVGILLLPMSYGLYTQFDLHPEKTVNGATGVSGLRFYYWTQSFGRITGESVWKNNTGFSFLYTNLLWGLIPFTIFFIMATIRGFIKLFRCVPQTEWISTFAVLLAYLALGISKFQLPHYIYIVLPFICLLVARYFVSIYHFFPHKFRILRVLHNTLLYLLLFILPALTYYFFPGMTLGQKVFLGIIYMIIYLIIYGEKKKKLSLLVTSVLIAVCLNGVLNVVFYPNLLPYQKEYTIAKQLQEKNIPLRQLASYKLHVRRSADFSLQYDIPVAQPENVNTFTYILTGTKGLKSIDELGQQYTILYEAEEYHIAKLKIGFLMPSTRGQYTTPYYLLKLLN